MNLEFLKSDDKILDRERKKNLWEENPQGIEWEHREENRLSPYKLHKSKQTSLRGVAEILEAKDSLTKSFLVWCFEYF